MPNPRSSAPVVYMDTATPIPPGTAEADATERKAQKVIVIPDLHIPYHDKAKLAIALADAKDADHVILIGDLIDAYSVSSYDKNPARKDTLQDELDQAKAVLHELRASNPTARIDLCDGNHENRLVRLLWQKAPALASLRSLSVAELLGLDDLAITWHSRSGFKAYGWRFKHGDVVHQKAGYTARKEMESHRCSGVSGHTHRQGVARITDKEGVSDEWWEAGHLCQPASAEYVANPDWQAGYLRLSIHRGLIVHVEAVRL